MSALLIDRKGFTRWADIPMLESGDMPLVWNVVDDRNRAGSFDPSRSPSELLALSFTVLHFKIFAQSPSGHYIYEEVR